MKIKLFAVLAAVWLTSVLAEDSESWSWNNKQDPVVTDAEAERRADENKEANANPAPASKKPEGEGRHIYSDQEIYSNDTSIDEVVNIILDSSRQGRNLDGYDEVYTDPSVQEALQRGDDTEARNLIREKLCSLGLMQCDNAQGKRPFGPPPGYYQGAPPRGPYGPPRPMPPPGKFGPGPGINTYGPPPSKFGPLSPPLPPPPGKFGPPPPLGPNKYGPPRKVGFEGPPSKPFHGPVYPGPQFGGADYEFSKPPPGAIIYGSKPPGPIVSESEPPFEFEGFGEKIHHQSSFEQHSEGHFGSGKPTIVVNAQGGAAGATNGAQQTPTTPLQQHVHHHFHHVEGGEKIPNVPVPIPTGNGIVGDFASISGSSGYDLKAQQSTAFNAGFNAAAGSTSLLSGGFNGVNVGKGPGPGGLYTSTKPISESGFNPSFNPGLGTYGSGASLNGPNGGGFNGASFSQGSSGGFSSNNGFNGGFGASESGSYHSTNPDYFKKEVSVSGPNGNNGIYGYGQGSNFGSQSNGQYSQFNNGELYQGFETARQGVFDCVCVPYDQCPAADRIGRKDDLILPLDPRNLGKDIEALADEAAPENSTIADADKFKAEQQPENTEVKKISKRNVAEAKEKVSEDAIDNAADAEGRVSVPVSEYEFTKRKVLPTFGVSFGLPYPSGGYPFNAFGGGYPAPNPYFGSIGPNGLHLGLLNVNPLLSLQVTKNEYGEKLVKPLVNLHVTPNEHIIHKVGQLFQAKKEVLLNTHEHYHHHSHHAYPPPPPIYHPDHHPHPHPPIHLHPHLHPHPPHHHPGHFPSGPEFHPEIIPSYEAGTYGFPGPNYRDSAELGSEPPQDYNIDGGSNHLYSEYNGDEYFKRSSNVSNGFAFPSSSEYAGQYDYDFQRRQHRGLNVDEPSSDLTRPIPTAAPGHAAGGKNVAFPSDRKKRSTDLNDSVRETLISKRQAFYGGKPQQCRQDQVCCRRPLRPPQQQQQQYGKCGVRNAHGITGRIKNPVYVDGDSEFGEYPWQAAILKKDPKESVYVCGGTIIDGLHIITAAHCIKTYSGFDLRVRLGEWDVNHDVEFFPYVERDIISVHVHPEYYAGTLDNDLAILKLDRPIDFSKSPHISPACLPDKFSDFTGARCWTTGWGKDAFGSFGKYQNILKEVDVPILNNQQCQSQLRQTRLGYNYVLNPGFICAGGEEGKDACKGDGGGPMVCERNGVWQVVGVVSWGIGCGQVNVPGVYVRVSHYLDWIYQITRNF